MNWRIVVTKQYSSNNLTRLTLTVKPQPGFRNSVSRYFVQVIRSGGGGGSPNQKKKNTNHHRKLGREWGSKLSSFGKERYMCLFCYKQSLRFLYKQYQLQSQFHFPSLQHFIYATFKIIFTLQNKRKSCCFSTGWKK